MRYARGDRTQSPFATKSYSTRIMADVVQLLDAAYHHLTAKDGSDGAADHPLRPANPADLFAV